MEKQAPSSTALKPLIHGALALLLATLTACFDSNTEDPPPSVQQISGDQSATAPKVQDDTLSVPPGKAGIVEVLNNDSAADNGGLTVESFDAVSQQGGSVSYNGDGTFTYAPAAGFEGEDSFTYTVIDSRGNKSVGTVIVTVSASVIPNGKAYYAANCAVCHAAGTDDGSTAFAASDLGVRAHPLVRDLSIYGGEYRLMGTFYDVEQAHIDELKAYLAAF